MNIYERLPKVELHLHLEGSIPLETLWELVVKYGGDKASDGAGVASLAALRERFRYRDFPHFIETWLWKNEFLREAEDFTRIAEAVARDLAAQNIRYAEAFYSPPDFAHHGLSVAELTAAIRRGLDAVSGIEVHLVADLVRDYGAERAERTLDEIREARELGILGVGLGGSEQKFPPEPFADVFRRARDLGFKTSCHAGEAAGASSVRGALDVLEVDRIGHGTRAVEDDRLLDELAERRVPIECCPISNVRTGVIPSVAEHPIRRFLDRGIPVSVNTDDPKMFGNSLAEEYAALATELGFTDDEIRDLVLAAVDAAWLSEERREVLRRSLVGDPGWKS